MPKFLFIKKKILTRIFGDFEDGKIVHLMFGILWFGWLKCATLVKLVFLSLTVLYLLKLRRIPRPLFQYNVLCYICSRKLDIFELPQINGGGLNTMYMTGW